MLELPLFPLNTVLFPGMPLPLHIFEPRYKELIQDCIEGNNPFGVVLIKSGYEAGSSLAEPYEIGCTALIEQLEPLQGGRFNLIAVGQERFRITAFKHDRSYLVGMVEPYPVAMSNPTLIARAERYLRPLVVRYLETLSQLSGADFDVSQLPDDTLALGFLAVSFLDLPKSQKQSFLATESASRLLIDVYDIYKEQVPILSSMPKQDLGGFSIN